LLAGQFGIDVALLVEPFVRAILRQPRNEKPVALDCYWRANSAAPNVLPNANIEAHRIENHSVVCHDSLIKKEAAPNARQLLFVKLEGLHGPIRLNRNHNAMILMASIGLPVEPG